jgi:hypothetical protein
MASIFNNVGGIKPRLTNFDLTYKKKFNCKFGQLIPIMCDEVVPGDTFNINAAHVLRFQPMAAPVLHEFNVKTHYFFVPYRILDENFETFITGGDVRTDSAGNVLGLEGDNISLPRWKPSLNNAVKYSLWDYFGFPLFDNSDESQNYDDRLYPLDYPRRAYNLVYNEYYRDENIQPPVQDTNEQVLNVGWKKDYFTSALPWQQKGIAPALDVSGILPLQWRNYDPRTGGVYNNVTGDLVAWTGTGQSGQNAELFTRSTGYGAVAVTPNGLGLGTSGNVDQVGFQANTGASYAQAVVDLGNSVGFDVAELRLAFQIQKFLERNARGGTRYTEFLRSHFGVSPRDERLQRPEYIGGTYSPIFVNEVLQNSTPSAESDTPTGMLRGKAMSVDNQHVGNYHCSEFGLIIGLMSIVPKAAYSQGINRQWLRDSRYDFYFPEFANLSEQAIYTDELYWPASTNFDTPKLFAYQGRYDEMRIKHDMVCADLRPTGTLNYWSMFRNFESEPRFNDNFIEMQPDTLLNIFMVQNEPPIVVEHMNIITASRPLPYLAEPGLIDHNGGF